jgi:hypothetical protein
MEGFHGCVIIRREGVGSGCHVGRCVGVGIEESNQILFDDMLPSIKIDYPRCLKLLLLLPPVEERALVFWSTGDVATAGVACKYAPNHLTSKDLWVSPEVEPSKGTIHESIAGDGHGVVFGG